MSLNALSLSIKSVVSITIIITGFWSHNVNAQTPSPSATLAKQRANDFIKAVNSNNRTEMRKFINENFTKSALERVPVEARINTLWRAYEETRGFTLVSVRETKPTETTALVKSKMTDQLWQILVIVEPQAPYQIDRSGAGIAPPSPDATQPTKKLSDAEIATELGSFLKKLSDADFFSGAVLLAHNDKVIFKQAYGMANKDYNVLNRVDTKFNLGSAGKMFTAVAIARLVEQGKLSYEDSLSKFLPDVVEKQSAEKIKIKHLLSHTSGLASFFIEAFFNASRARYRSVDDYLELVKEDKSAFEPGTKWQYSNTGFLLLGKVIEKVTGQNYSDYMQENIYKKAGMLNSGTFELDRINPNLAIGYGKEFTDQGTIFRNNVFIMLVQGGPAGGGYSTVEDMLSFANALNSEKLINAGSAKLLMSPKPELSSPNYGYGFAASSAGIGHHGDFEGVSSSMYLANGYTFVILSNYDRTRSIVTAKINELIQSAKQ
jgi:CubicO group peptidase (beta-lactamase class C family)